jgi:hypothetical protein
MASSPYNNLNGENCVVLDVVVLWDQITLGSSSARRGVVGPDHPRQLFGPLAFWQIGDVPFYTGEDYSICPFHRPIGLRVVD